MRLSNGIAAFEFSDDTGSLVQIEDQRHGVKHLAMPEDGRLFKMVVPDEANWLDRHAESHLCGRPEQDLRGGTLTLRYPDVKTVNGKSVGIEALVRVALPAGADEARFTITVTNRGPAVVHEVWFPRVGGWRGRQGAASGQAMIGCSRDRAFDLFAFPRQWGPAGYSMSKAHRRRFWNFPIIVFPMLDVSGGGYGLSYIQYPSKPEVGGILIEDLNEQTGGTRPAWSWVHRPFLRPGASWTGETVGIAPHAGDWRQTAARMKAWLDSWWRPPASPASLRSSLGYFCMMFRDFMGRERAPVGEAPAIARYAMEHGLDAGFSLWDTPMQIYMRPGSPKRGDFFADDPERLAALSGAVREIRRTGLQVNTLVNLRLITRRHPRWEECGEKWMLRGRYGEAIVEDWTGGRGEHAEFLDGVLSEDGVRLCQDNPEFQTWALAMMAKVADMGYSSIFIDQAFEAVLCFSDRHGHRVPSSPHAGACQWTRQVTEMLRRRDPQAYTLGENANIWNSQGIDLWWNWDWAALPADLFRLILPDCLQSWGIDAYEHQDQVGKAFAMGFLFATHVRGLEKPLSTVPDFAARLKQLAALRRKTAAFTVNGQFLDRQGLTVDTDAEIAATVYRAGSRGGIVLGGSAQAPGSSGAARLTFQPAACGLELPAEAILHRQDGSRMALPLERRTDSVAVELRVDRSEAAVIELA